MILNLFPRRPDHLLADAKELKRVLADLHVAKAGNAVDEVMNWFESLKDTKDFRLDHYFDILRQLDEAAQPHLRRLARDYLQTVGLPRAEEQRLWTKTCAYWREIASLYSASVERSQRDPKGKGVDLFKTSLALADTRAQAARNVHLKWLAYRYGPIDDSLWMALGQTYLAAENAGHAQKLLQLYPTLRGMTSVAQQYLRAIVFFASSMDSLLPLQIELADRLIAHFLPCFVFSADCRRDSVYWVDAASGSVPVRLARHPGSTRPGLRFYSPGTVLAALEELIHVVEHGEIPPDLNLGGDYPPNVLLPVLRHLRVHWSVHPPQRLFQRHAVKTRVTVRHGFSAGHAVFGRTASALESNLANEVWLVENVSRGGFRACVADNPADRITLGTLLSLQPEGGDNWLLGVVRRFNRLAGGRVNLGIQLLSRQAQSIDLRPRRSGFSAAIGVPGIWLRDGGTPGQVRIVLPRGDFNVRETLEFADAGQRHVLTPAELEESGADYDIGRFHDPSSAA
ncbi:hypothetical protein [Accumulibacter sp.]|uniref:hypothetical protein n=1 Tax=Accumulibacter sp. TaxID=2053492 RepID=UPI002603780F|nr:hypothetical protein [Accumulibacter sp.]